MKRKNAVKMLALMLAVSTLAGSFAWGGVGVAATPDEKTMKGDECLSDQLELGEGSEGETQEDSNDNTDDIDEKENGEQDSDLDDTTDSDTEEEAGGEGSGIENGGSEEDSKNAAKGITPSEKSQENDAQLEKTGEKEDESEEILEELEENSWRYRDGELILPSTFRSGYKYAWEKVDGYYRNSSGNIIEGALKKGIDVSYHNGTIDWEKVKADGVDFAIIRCGYGDNYTSQDDKQWERNVSECERLGIPYGVYLYSYAESLEQAKSEAEHALRLLEGHNPTYPVYYDMEENNVRDNVSSSKKGQIAQTFCDALAAAGYRVGIYANKDWWTNYLTDSRFDNPNWSKWVAQYNDECTYEGIYDIWQCASDGSVDGIAGNVDINFLFGIPGLSGLQYDSLTGKYYYYTNGRVDTSYTGLAQNEYGWWYIKNGQADFTYTGMAYNQNGWQYVKNGKVDPTYTGLAQNEYGWWYMRNGKVDRSYTGLAQNEYGWWYVINGYIDFSYSWVVQNEYGWWAVRNGGVDFGYTGIAQNEYGWWYIQNGQVIFTYTGLAQNEYGWWYLVNGQVDFNHTGLAQNEYGWWYVKNGGVDFTYDGIAKNEYGWWYVENGEVIFSYSGTISYQGEKYKVINGEVMH